MNKRTQIHLDLGKGWDCVYLNGPDGETLIVRGPKGERIELANNQVQMLRIIMKGEK